MIAAALLREGVVPDTPVVVVENASLPDSRRLTLTLRDLPAIADLGLQGPATILLGSVYAEVAADVAERPTNPAVWTAARKSR